MTVKKWTYWRQSTNLVTWVPVNALNVLTNSLSGYTPVTMTQWCCPPSSVSTQRGQPGWTDTSQQPDQNEHQHVRMSSLVCSCRPWGRLTHSSTPTPDPPPPPTVSQWQKWHNIKTLMMFSLSDDPGNQSFCLEWTRWKLSTCAVTGRRCTLLCYTWWRPH